MYCGFHLSLWLPWRRLMSESWKKPVQCHRQRNCVICSIAISKLIVSRMLSFSLIRQSHNQFLNQISDVSNAVINSFLIDFLRRVMILCDFESCSSWGQGSYERKWEFNWNTHDAATVDWQKLQVENHLTNWTRTEQMLSPKVTFV